MSRGFLPLSQLRAFEAAARHGSFKRAAEELSVTPAAISHQVRELESRLGVVLFERKVRKIVPTGPAERLYPVLNKGFDAFSEVLASIVRGGEARAVTLSTTRAFASQWLLPRLFRFSDRHPDIDLRIHASETPVDLGRESSLAIRYGPGPYPGHEVVELAVDTFTPVASPRLDIDSVEDLARFRLIHFEWQHPRPGLPTWPLWFQAADRPLPDTRSGLNFSDESHAIQAAIAGQGVALLSRVLVRDEIERGVLRVPFGPSLSGLRYCLLRHRRFADDDVLNDVAKWVQEEFRTAPL